MRRWLTTLAAGLLPAVLFTVTAALPAHADAVTEWTREADRLGGGRANWRSLAIMHAAMHDAVNAVSPQYQRWAPAERGEPPADGANAEAALDAAAAEALTQLHPLHESEVDQVFTRLIQRLPKGANDPGVALGRAIGAAAARRHKDDGYYDLSDFPTSEAAGKWRHTPPYFESGLINSMQPFLFPSRGDFAGVPPPALGSPAYARDLQESRELGGETSTARTAAQTTAARFWAFQSSQRGFVLLAATLLDRDAEPSRQTADAKPSRLAAHAQIMSQLSAALADSAILIWAEKERYLAWRPVTAIRAEAANPAPDPQWAPLIETPAHPEYPSGHASDCYVGSDFLAAVFGAGLGPVTYVAQGAPQRPEQASVDMGQHAQPGNARDAERRFASVEAAASECLESRIWAGAHFRSAENESRRVAALIVAAALRKVPRS